MSNAKVKDFLLKKEQEKESQEAQLKYNVLSHYDLGETSYYQDGDNIEDFPFYIEKTTSSGKTVGKRFKYICNISDEDYEKIKEIYEKENPKSNTDEIKDGAEKTLNICALILLILGIIVFIAMLIVAADDYDFNWSLFGIGAGVFFTSLIEFAFAKVLVNISRKLNKLG